MISTQQVLVGLQGEWFLAAWCPRYALPTHQIITALLCLPQLATYFQSEPRVPLIIPMQPMLTLMSSRLRKSTRLTLRAVSLRSALSSLCHDLYLAFCPVSGGDKHLPTTHRLAKLAPPQETRTSRDKRGGHGVLLTALVQHQWRRTCRKRPTSAPQGSCGDNLEALRRPVAVAWITRSCC